jgi:fluoroquinolone resistance protein
MVGEYRMLNSFSDLIFDSRNVQLLQSSCPGEFEDCQFEAIKFAGFSLKSSKFLNCKFSRCNFAGSDLLRSSFRDVEFIECQLMGINWAALTRFESCSFQSCKLDYSVFQGLKLRRLKCIDSSLKEADFSDADLSESDFSGSILVGASFAGADISKADLRTAKEYFIDPRSTKIKGAKFCFPEAASLLAALGAEVDF